MTAVHLVGMALPSIQPTIQGRTTMDDATIINFTGRDTISDPLTDLLRKGAYMRKRLSSPEILGSRAFRFPSFRRPCWLGIRVGTFLCNGCALCALHQTYIRVASSDAGTLPQSRVLRAQRSGGGTHLGIGVFQPRAITVTHRPVSSPAASGQTRFYRVRRVLPQWERARFHRNAIAQSAVCERVLQSSPCACALLPLQCAFQTTC